jgi:hypothetical protein
LTPITWSSVSSCFRVVECFKTFDDCVEPCVQTLNLLILPTLKGMKRWVPDLREGPWCSEMSLQNTLRPSPPEEWRGGTFIKQISPMPSLALKTRYTLVKPVLLQHSPSGTLYIFINITKDSPKYTIPVRTLSAHHRLRNKPGGTFIK